MTPESSCYSPQISLGPDIKMALTESGTQPLDIPMTRDTSKPIQCGVLASHVAGVSNVGTTTTVEIFVLFHEMEDVDGEVKLQEAAETNLAHPKPS